MPVSAHMRLVEVDKIMSMSKQVNNVPKTCFLQLHKRYKVRKCVNEEEAKVMVHEPIKKADLIIEMLYFAVYLRVYLPDVLLNRLYSVQKAAARFITISEKYDHITHVMESGHWLPIWDRMNYKILLLTYKALNSLAYTYLSDLLQLTLNQGSTTHNVVMNWTPRSIIIIIIIIIIIDFIYRG